MSFINFVMVIRLPIVGLFEFMLYIQVNSYGHVGTLPPFNGTYSQHNVFENYNHPNKQ